MRFEKVFVPARRLLHRGLFRLPSHGLRLGALSGDDGFVEGSVGDLEVLLELIAGKEQASS